MAQRILVVEPSLPRRLRLVAVLREARYDVVAAAEPGSEDHATPPDLAICGDEDTAVIADLSQGLAPAPVLAMGRTVEADGRLAVFSAGARDLLGHDVPDDLLLARIRSLLREGEALRETSRRRETAIRFGFAEAGADFAQRRRVALVGMHSSEDLKLANSDLRPVDADDILSDEQGAPDAVVVAVTDPVRRLVPELRARRHTRHSAILFLHAPGANLDATRALDDGANDIAPADAGSDEIALRLERLLGLKAAEDALRRSSEASYALAMTDSLTGLYNRRYAEIYLSDVLRRDCGEFTVMMIDIDHFKEINDRHGHAAGDAVLRELAKRLRQNLRAADLAARFGGEEFLVVLPDVARDRARPAADRLRRRICKHPFSLPGGGDTRLTVSIGVTVKPPGGELTAGPALSDFIVEAADRALYRAKRAGRDRVDLSPPAGLAV